MDNQELVLVLLVGLLLVSNVIVSAIPVPSATTSVSHATPPAPKAVYRPVSINGGLQATAYIYNPTVSATVEIIG